MVSYNQGMHEAIGLREQVDITVVLDELVDLGRVGQVSQQGRHLIERDPLVETRQCNLDHLERQLAARQHDSYSIERSSE